MAARLLNADEFVSHREQMQPQVQQETVGPIVLMNKFSVNDPKDVDAFVATWTRSAQYMKQQPGFLFSQFHRGIAANTFLNYASWESLAALGTADRSAGFLEIIAEIPESVTAMPYAFQRVAVPNACVGP
jgi:quinol monooxygenase YgiN